MMHGRWASTRSGRSTPLSAIPTQPRTKSAPSARKLEGFSGPRVEHAVWNPQRTDHIVGRVGGRPVHIGLRVATLIKATVSRNFDFFSFQNRKRFGCRWPPVSSRPWIRHLYGDTGGGKEGIQVRNDGIRVCFTVLSLLFLGSTADANLVNKVIQILTNLEAQIKAEGMDSPLVATRSQVIRHSL